MAALPVRDGIPASRVYLPAGSWVTLLDFLVERFPRIEPAILVQRLEKGEIVDEHGTPQRVDSPYRSGQWLWYYREVPDEVPVPFDLPILYRDERIIAVDKPHFMASTPGGRYLRHTALVRLRSELGLTDLAPMHRLDRDTAGVLVFSIQPRYRGAYQTLFQSRAVYKEYEAVAKPPADLPLPLVHRSRLQEIPGGFIMDEIPGEPNSETRIELIRTLGDGASALLKLLPVTGRKHQLRAHLNALGMPIINDSFYPRMLPQAEDDFSKPLQLLARVIEFRDPITDRRLRIESKRQLLVR